MQYFGTPRSGQTYVSAEDRLARVQYERQCAEAAAARRDATEQPGSDEAEPTEAEISAWQEQYEHVMSFNFVEDIDWPGIAAEAGKVLVEGASLGYCGNSDYNTYAARTTDGGAIIWTDGSVEVMSAEEFATHQRSHAAVQFP